MITPTGTLTVRPQAAKLVHGHHLLSKVDPYVVVQVGTQKLQTQVAKSAGNTPGWSDTLSFKVNGESTILVTVMDKDKITKDDFIGDVTIAMTEIAAKPAFTNTYEIREKGKPSGTLTISFEWLNQGMNAGMNMSSAMGISHQPPTMPPMGLSGPPPPLPIIPPQQPMQGQMQSTMAPTLATSQMVPPVQSMSGPSHIVSPGQSVLPPTGPTALSASGTVYPPGTKIIYEETTTTTTTTYNGNVPPHL